MNSKMNTKKTLLASMVGLFAAAGGASSAMAQGDEAATAQGRIDEIIVTANKREQSLQDTAMSISALSGETIEKRNLVGMDDYLRTLPGVSMHDRGVGQNSIIVRGIATNPQLEDSTVGVYFGETPVTNLGTSDSGGGAGNADIKLVDIDRIEVLRGPQGTLYGSGSMGGTVKVVPAMPDLEQQDGRIATRYSNTGNQGGSNTMVQGMINIPLVEDKLAFRGVAYRFDNSGYIENVVASVANPSPANTAAIAQGGIGQDRSDVGGDDYTGFRLSALWRPIDDLNVTVNYLNQEIDQDGAPEINMILNGKFQQERLKTGSGGQSDELKSNDIDLTNLTLDYDFGWSTLNSSTSRINYNSNVEGDVSFVLFAPWFQSNKSDVEVFVEEIRLTSQLDGPIQFIAGVYYEDIKKNIDSDILWSGPIAADPGNAFITTDSEEEIKQWAFFGEISYLFTEEITTTIGLRHFDYEKSEQILNTFLGSTTRDEGTDFSENGQSFKANLSWRPSDETLIYGQWSEGFRLGKALTKPTSLCDLDNDGILDDLGIPIPKGVGSDTSENFEVGLKTSFAHNRVQLSTSLYRINWEAMPVSIILACRGAVTFNAGEAESEGVELEAKVQLAENIIMDFSASYGEARLKDDIPNAVGFGEKGDNLPGSADFNISVSGEYRFYWEGFDAYARGEYAYVSEYYHNFSETGQASGGYEQINLKTGITVNSFEIDIYINNLTNADDFTWVESVWGAAGNRGYRLRPRTVGLNIGYRF